MRHKVFLDVDGVLAAYSHWQGVDHIGEPIDGALEMVKNIAKDHDVVIYTTRLNMLVNPGFTQEELNNKVKTWLDKHGFPYSELNTTKPLFSALIDDRAISCRPQAEPQYAQDEFEYAQVMAKVLCANAK